MVYSIHFLRFVASFLVLCSHSNDVMAIPMVVRLGDAGVDIFFVISGFVIGLVGRTEPSTSEFYAKRFIRVVPLYWIALGAMMAFKFAKWRWLPEESDFFHSLLLIPKMEKDWSMVLFPAWTLSYEIFFYAVFGAALKCFGNRASAVCMIVLPAIGVTAFPYVIYALDTTLLLEFVGGLLIADYYLSHREIDRRLGALLIAAAVGCFYLTRHGANIRAMQWGVPSGMLVLGALQFEDLAFIRHSFVVLLGSASYATYLFHITVMIAIHEQLRDWLHFDMNPYIWSGRVSLIVISICFGILIHLLLERPLLNALRQRLLRPRITGLPA